MMQPSRRFSTAQTFAVRIRRMGAMSLALGISILTPNAWADDAPPTQDATPVLRATPANFLYGIFIGNNQGGPGQETLRFAEEDARRMQQTMAEVGRQGPTELTLLPHPTGVQVVQAIEKVAEKLKGHRERGEQAVFFFYYSGHARASALNLGSDDLPVELLRQRLALLPSTLTFVILDACQSGSFARAKGASRAEDFSFNSVQGLTTKGLAVMASSTAEELSQESDELHGSFFTHHFVAALRGAADADADGRVTLNEAYTYSAKRTLASTVKTRLGGQHVTFESDLAGRGDVILSYPRAARAQLELAPALDARVMLAQRPSGNVVAEVYKSPGKPLRIALLAGTYDATVRQSGVPSGSSGTSVVQCTVQVYDGAPSLLDLGSCTPVKDEGGSRKGDDDAPAPTLRIASLGLAIGFTSHTSSAYTDRLAKFSYKETTGILSPKLALSGSYGSENLQVGGLVHYVAGQSFARTFSESNETTSYRSYDAQVFGRAQDTIGRLPLGGFARVSGGVGIANIDFSALAGTSPRQNSELHVGPVVGAALGIFGQTSGLRVGIEGGLDYAPLGQNLLGDTLNTGGGYMMLTFDLLLTAHSNH